MPVENELSERELEILRQVATGASNKEIALQLTISPNTVKVHLKNIFAKIEVASRTEATLYAIRHQIVDSPGQLPVPQPGEHEDLTLTYNTHEDVERQSTGVEVLVPPVVTPVIIPVAVQSGPIETVGSIEASTRRRIPVWIVVLAGAFLVVVAVVAGMGLSGWLHPVAPIPTQTPVIATQDIRPTLTSVAATSSAAAFEKAQAAALATLQAQSASGAAVRWAQLADLPEGRSNLAAAVYENRIYAIGGDTAQGISGAVTRYDPDKNSWQTLTAKPQPVADIQAVLLGEKIYVPGGRLANGQPTNLLEVYNPRQDAWERKADLPEAVSGYSLAALDGRMVLFGGWDGQKVLASVYEYDPAADRWTRKTDMPTARAFSGAAASDGKVYVMGGSDGKQSLTVNEVYFESRDGTQETPWETRSPLPEARQGMGMTILANHVFLLGGDGLKGKALSHPALQYLAGFNTWQSTSDSPFPVGSGMALVGLDSRLYVIGGRYMKILVADCFSYQALYTINFPVIP
jgi:DNA-binding CsgD family transcriptional regulator/N-acetylneuraminic acid mutarotase